MNVIGKTTREKFLDVAERVLEKFIALPQNPKPEKKGCYICVMIRNGSKIILISELGVCDLLDSDKCFSLSQEKPFRMLLHGHFTSSESRDPENGKYGGAIIAPRDSGGLKAGREIAIGISGLPEKGDEAVALVIALFFKWITLYDAQRIIKISGNELFEPLLEACSEMFIFE